jgi:CubicO group peptidase (beta-lactamase class C family)
MNTESGITRRKFAAIASQIPVAAAANAAFAGEAPTNALGRHQELAARYLDKFASNADPGLGVSVRKGSKEVVRWSTGIGDLDHGIRISPDTVFHVASVSKQFTAVAILLLAKEGKLSLSDKAKKYISDLPAVADGVLISDMLSHLSGLRDQWSLHALSGRNMEDLITQNHVVQLAYMQDGLCFPPGTEFSYCNTGFTLLAEIVAKVSGRSFASFLKENVFSPLKMDSSFVYDDSKSVVPGRAQSYVRKRGGKWQFSRLNYETWGPTSVHSTASDLTLWGSQLILNGGDWGQIFEKMIAPGTLRDGKKVSYGAGLQIGKLFGSPAAFHGGSDAGFRTYTLYLPEHQLSVAVLANTPMAVAKIAQDVAAICLDAPANAAGPSQVPAPEWARNLIGRYTRSSGLMIEIVALESGYGLNAPGSSIEPQAAQKIFFRDDGSFDLGAPDAVFFRPAYNSNHALCAIEEVPSMSGLSVIFDRIGDVPPIRNLEEFSGLYHSSEIDCSYRLTAKAGILICTTISDGSSIEFQMMGRDRAMSSSWYMTLLIFDRDRNGKITGFSVSSGRCSGVKFFRTNFSRV